MWHTKTYRRMNIDNHLDDWDPLFYSRYSSRKMADKIIKAGAKAAFVWARCHVGSCYYNTKLGPKHKGLKKHDQVGELIELFHARGVKAIVYYSVIFDVKVAKTHPDWQQMEKGGKYFGEGSRYKILCPCSPYTEYTAECLKELAANYDMDGIWLDMTFWPTVCYCKFCQERFRQVSGCGIPKEPDWNSPVWKSFIKWRYQVMTGFIKTCVDAVHAVKPGLWIGYQYPNPIMSTWKLGVNVDSVEPGALPAHDVYYPSGHINMSLVPRLFRAITPQMPCEIFIGRHVSGLSDPTSIKPMAHMEAETFSVLANGGAIYYTDQINPDGTLYKRPWPMFRKLFMRIKKREPWLGGAPVKFAGVYFSERTRDFYGKDDPEGRYLQAFKGACRLCLERHILFDIVTHRNIGSLPDYSVLFLPNVACLNQGEVEAIIDFVKRGGGLVATYETSSSDGEGNLRGKPALAELFGIKEIIGKTDYDATYIRLVGRHPLTAGIDKEMPLSHQQFPQLIVGRGKGKVHGVLVYPMTKSREICVSIHNNPPVIETKEPAILTNLYGRGRTVYFTGQPDAIYAKFGYPEMGQLLSQAIRWAAAQSFPIELEAPVSVEVTGFLQKLEKRMVIHLVNAQSEIGRNLFTKGNSNYGGDENLHLIQEVIPVYDLRISVALEPGMKPLHARLQPDNRKIQFVVNNGRISLKIPELHIHQMLVLEMG